MAFRLEDFKKTTRKASGEGRVPASVYPHQMRDKKALSRLQAAIHTFDGLVGKRRGELDATVMADFFGDPRVARGVISCLGRFYRYSTRSFVEVVGELAAERLHASGLSDPMLLRAYTYAWANTERDGFLREDQITPAYTEMGSPFGVNAHDWDTLLSLDLEENQVLSRPGMTPTASEIGMLYNFHSYDTVLRRADAIRLDGIALTTADAADLRAVARRYGVRASIATGGASVALSPEQLGPELTHRPGRLGRCLLHVLQTGDARRLTGHVDAALGPRRFRLTLTPEILTVLGGKRLPVSSLRSLRRRVEATDRLHQDLLRWRARESNTGWRLQRLPEPIVTVDGVLLPDLTITREGRTVLVRLDETFPECVGLPTVTVRSGRKALPTNDVVARVEAAWQGDLFTIPTPPVVPEALRTLCDRAASVGMVTAADAQRTLHLLDESPLIEWVQRAADDRVRYVPGIGLCSRDLVNAIHALTPEGMMTASVEMRPSGPA